MGWLSVFMLPSSGRKSRKRVASAIVLQFARGREAVRCNLKSHLAVLERRIRGEAVPDFWALHALAEETVGKALGQPD